jgi:hypothetical protein
LLLAGLLGCELAASAATYNFIFNNTEQGDGSTASPSLSVASDGTVSKSGGGADSKPLVRTQGIAQAPGGETTVVSETSAPRAAAPAFRHFRFTGAASLYEGRYSAAKGPWATGSFAYFFNPEWGLNAFGVLATSAASNELEAGLEFEIVPIRISLGRVENLVELGFMGGLSHAQDWNDPHLGARVNVNLGESWGLTACGRYAADYAMAEAGLALRL